MEINRSRSVAARRAAATRAARRESAAVREDVDSVESPASERGFGSKFPWLTLDKDGNVIDSRPFGVGKHGPHQTLNASVFAIDPGGTTGWCFVDSATLFGASEDDYDVIADQIPCHEAAEDENDLEAMLPGEIACAERIVKMYKLFIRKDRANGLGVSGSGCGVALVTEDFIPRVFNASRSFLSPVRINTLLASILIRESLPGLVYQQASLGKTTISDDYLKSVGLFNIGGRHANDATRHALTYLRRVDNNGALHTPFMSRSVVS